MNTKYNVRWLLSLMCGVFAMLICLSPTTALAEETATITIRDEIPAPGYYAGGIEVETDTTPSTGCSPTLPEAHVALKGAGDVPVPVKADTIFAIGVYQPNVMEPGIYELVPNSCRHLSGVAEGDPPVFYPITDPPLQRPMIGFTVYNTVPRPNVWVAAMAVDSDPRPETCADELPLDFARMLPLEAVEDFRVGTGYTGKFFVGTYYYSGRGKTVKLLADSCREIDGALADIDETVYSVPFYDGTLVITPPRKQPRTFPSLRVQEYDAADYTVLMWKGHIKCSEINPGAVMGRFGFPPRGEDDSVRAVWAGDYTLATYMRYGESQLVYQGACQHVTVGFNEEVRYRPNLSLNQEMAERYFREWDSIPMEGNLLFGAGLRFDDPREGVVVSSGLTVVGKMAPIPTYWLDADPDWTAGYQFMVDLRKFAAYNPALSWGIGGFMQKQLHHQSDAGMIEAQFDLGLMLGTGAHGASCAYDSTVEDFDLRCYGPLSAEGSIPAGFSSFYGGFTAAVGFRWNVDNSGWYIGADVWGMLQLYMPMNYATESGLTAGGANQAEVLLSDGTTVSVPYRWRQGLIPGGMIVPAISVGRRF